MKALKKIALIMSAAILAVSFQSKVYAQSKDNKVFSQNAEKKNMIALTFDDGPHPRYTPQILDILEKYGITATFFIIGINAVNYPDAMRRLVDSGCEIANHTFSHSTLDKGKAHCISEIIACDNEIKKYIAEESRLLRPPQGKLNEDTISAANALDYNIILWSIDTLDWKHNSTDNIVKTVLSSVNGGDIILMHDYVSGKNTTCASLEIIIPELLARGYQFVTVSELIS